jgi:hypothetical protein
VAEDPVADPYRSCEQRCSHDLGDGVLLRELLGGDGPYPPGYWLVTLAPRPNRSPLLAAGAGH